MKLESKWESEARGQGRLKGKQEHKRKFPGPGPLIGPSKVVPLLLPCRMGLRWSLAFLCFQAQTTRGTQ
jgi:hypothetical protein